MLSVHGCYQPYSEETPDGYNGDNPTMGVSMRETLLMARS